MAGADIVRVLAIGDGLLSLLLSGLTLLYFGRRGPPYKVRQHVTRVTLTYVAFVVYGVIEIADHFGTPMRGQLVALAVIFILATNAQVPLLAHERFMAKAGE